MPAAAQRKFTILLQDKNGVSLPNTGLILSGYGRQADVSALVGNPDQLSERWKNEPIGGDVRKTDMDGTLKINGCDLFREVVAAVAIIALDAEHRLGALGCSVAWLQPFQPIPATAPAASANWLGTLKYFQQEFAISNG